MLGTCAPNMVTCQNNGMSPLAVTKSTTIAPQRNSHAPVAMTINHENQGTMKTPPDQVSHRILKLNDKGGQTEYGM